MGERGVEANVRDERELRDDEVWCCARAREREDEGGASENDDKCSRNRAGTQKQ